MTRLRPSNPQYRTNNTLFILTGGPGQSGWTFVSLAALLFPDTYGITFILPDHRGCGLSSPLACDDNGSQNITAACIPYLISRWGSEGLKQFSITAAAHDIAVQIQYYQSIFPGRVAIYGVSYGTIWLDRFLQIYPNLVQSAIMDSVVNPLLFSVSQYDLWPSSIAMRFLAYCQFQIECNQHFPVDEPPHFMLSRLLRELDGNKQNCANNYLSKYQLTAEKLRNILSRLVGSSEQYFDSTVIPAIIFLLNRCNEEDVTALKFFFETSFKLEEITNEVNPPPLLVSLVLGFHITQSELWLALDQDEVDNVTILAWHKSTIIAGKIDFKYTSLRSQWPKYPLDQYRNKVASYSPVLMLSGQFDTAAPLDYAVQLLSLTGKTRTLYTFPLVGHVIIVMAAFEFTCPIHLICSWAFPDLFPPEWSNSTCIQDFPTKIDFVGATEPGQLFSLKYLNMSKPFGNSTSTSLPNSSIHLTYSFELMIYCALIFLTIFTRETVYH
ncbi:unnamed protein product [Rotaria sp. Silwood2]|nr:unnamed protein product [Rotaria sp. Silwood2]CAF4528081.1 unnamed protein product [Rotaria sp. Silwood2]